MRGGRPEELQRSTRCRTKSGMRPGIFVDCARLVSIRKSELTDYVGTLSDRKLAELSQALKVAPAIE